MGDPASAPFPLIAWSGRDRTRPAFALFPNDQARPHEGRAGAGDARQHDTGESAEPSPSVPRGRAFSFTGSAHPLQRDAAMSRRILITSAVPGRGAKHLGSPLPSDVRVRFHRKECMSASEHQASGSQ